MNLVKSLRTIITHKAANKFEGVRFSARRRDIRERGLLAFSDFQEVYNSETFPAKETWEFIVQLGIGIPLQETKGDKLMMIPCLINETMEPMINKIERDFDEDEDAVCVRYAFDRNSATIGLYHKFLQIFSQMFLWGKHGGDIDLAFSQKVEGKKLGCVGGVQGTMKWITKGMQDPEPFTFLILEYENEFIPEDSDDDTIKPFSVERELRIYIKPLKGKATCAIFNIFEKVDKGFSPFLCEVQRSLSCKECQKNRNDGFFFLDQGIHLTSTTRRCTPKLQHEPREKIVKLLEESRDKDLINLETLMAQDKSSLGLKPFESSQIKKDMEEGNLDAGHQIWIYHDSDTDPWNPVARLNKYAHVMVYIGFTEEEGRVGRTEIHEVVHVSASGVFGKAKIKRQEVLRVTKLNLHSKRSIVKYGVIKPTQMVFLGHEIKGCQFAANIKEKIVDRAKACAEKPSIVFDYDHRFPI